jgi:alginate O-acetyltransferase complex protein AlgI
MLFNTFDFLVFFVAVFVLQLVLPYRPRNALLLVASYIFYGAWNWRFLPLLMASTVIDYLMGLAIAGSEDEVRRKRFLVLSVIVNLALLGFFKYANFFVDSAETLLRGLGFHPAPWQLNVILPVGISFYTFQSMSYTIDVYRRKTEPIRSLFDYAVFVSFFPQLLAGPIERSEHLMPQLRRKPKFTLDNLRLGGWLVFWGLFKKAVIADNMAPIVDRVFALGAHPSGMEVLVGVYAFAFQIYADFSGYTDIARGVARLMGYELVVNFKLPYLATNPQDFWRRWHISLSSWLRDYLYVSLGGNRKGNVRTYVNLTLTMVLGGLWHGAAWTFALWGFYHGLLLAAHRYMAAHQLLPRFASAHMRRLWSVASCVVMFHLTCLGWLIFRAKSVHQIGEMLSAVASPLSAAAVVWAQPLWTIAVLCVPLFAVQYLQARTADLNVVLKLSVMPRAVLYAALVLMLVGLGAFGQREFIYFQF